MVPTIQEHLSMAQALDENLKSGMSPEQLSGKLIVYA